VFEVPLQVVLKNLKYETTAYLNLSLKSLFGAFLMASEIGAKSNSSLGFEKDMT
jgi:hypothetical protein